MIWHTPRAAARTLLPILALLGTLLGSLVPGVARAGTAPPTDAVPAGSYANPIIAQTAADPAVIKALDGYYYLMATSDSWQDGTFHLLPTWRSTDLVNWSFVADAFPARPDWVKADAGLWAPDLQYYNGRYYLYYTASDTNPLPRYGSGGGSAIGVATADSPAGPWTDMGDTAGGAYQHGPLVPPRPCAFNSDPNCYYWTFDPAEFTDQDGQKYLYYGSYFGGTLAQRLTADGLHLAGSAIQISHWDRYEGTYVVRHGGYYYNFSSTADCCRGPNTAYSVEVNRATSPLGPFIDQNGFPMQIPGNALAPTTRPVDDPAGDNIGAQGGGYPTLKQNGNIWHGVGHNALITDLSGQDWIVYHGVDVRHPWVNTSDPNARITFRQALLDRIDWTSDGWPVVNGGSGPSLQHIAPSATPLFGDNFNPAAGCAAPGAGAVLGGAWQSNGGSWDVNAGTCTTGGFAEQTGGSQVAALVHQAAVPLASRTECDLRLVGADTDGRYGCLLTFRAGRLAGRGIYLAASLDPGRNALVTALYYAGRRIGGEQVTALPTGFDHTDWHHLTIDVRYGRSPLGEDQTTGDAQAGVQVVISDRNRDPLAVQQQPLPGFLGILGFLGIQGSGVGFITQGARADFDNLTVAPLRAGMVPAPQTPALGTPLRASSDDFNGSLGPQWSWVREDPTKHAIVNQQLSITVNGDLYRESNTATNLLLEPQPSGDYVLETKVSFDPNQNYQQAGLLVYSDDDHYMKVGPFHGNSLNKILSGYESLEPLPSGATSCDVQPSATSMVAVATYTRDLCPNEGEGWDNLANPNPTLNGNTAASPTVVTWLRIYRRGDVYTPYSSLDDVHWVKGTAWSLGAVDAAHPIRVGLFAFSAGPNNNIPALFDYVHAFRQEQ